MNPCPVPRCVNYPVHGAVLCHDHERLAETVLYILEKVYDLEIIDEYDSDDETIFPLTRTMAIRKSDISKPKGKNSKDKSDKIVGDSK